MCGELAGLAKSERSLAAIHSCVLHAPGDRIDPWFRMYDQKGYTGKNRLRYSLSGTSQVYVEDDGEYDNLTANQDVRIYDAGIDMANALVGSGSSTPARSRHCLRRWDIVRQHIENGDVRLVHVPDANMPADFMTKWLSGKKLEAWRKGGAGIFVDAVQACCAAHESARRKLLQAARRRRRRIPQPGHFP